MPSTSELLAKISKIDFSQLEPDAQAQVQNLSILIQEIEVAQERAEDPSIKRLMDLYRLKIKDISAILQTAYSKDLPDRERDTMIARKEIYENFIQSFDRASADARLQKLNEDVDYYLEDDDKRENRWANLQMPSFSR